MALEDTRPTGPLDLILRFWRGETIVIRSPLPPTHVLSALADQVDPMFTLIGKRPASGHVGARGGWLRKRIRYRNSFQTILRFKVEAGGAGSRITCHIAAPWFARIFMVLWFLGVILIGGGGGLSAVQARDATAILVPSVMLAGGGLLIGFSRWLARDEAAWLLDLMLRASQGQVAR